MLPNSFGKSSGSHITRYVKYTDAPNSVSISGSDARRFWLKVQKGAGCWLWRGTINTGNGYGQFGVQAAGATPVQKLLYAHRVVWALSHGPISEGQHVLHHCDVPACVNPAHLFLGTHKTNMEDAQRKGRLHVPRPGRQRISDEEIAQIHVLAASGVKRVRIADRLAVSKAYVSLVLNGKRRQLRKVG